MAYLRWSSNNFNCDVYCYANCSGAWTTHVAGKRYTSYPEGELVPIGLPHDGESFDDVGPREMYERLLYLRELGYKIPQYGIDAVLEEAEEREKEQHEDRPD